MSGKYSNGVVNSKDVSNFHANELTAVDEILKNVENNLLELQTNRYLEDLWKALSIANQAITVHKPWVKIKEGKIDQALALVALVSNILARVAILLHPVMPKTTVTIAKALGFDITTANYDKYVVRKSFLDEFTIEKVPPLFPRIEEELMAQPTPPVVVEAAPAKKDKKEAKIESIITIDQFFETSLKIGTILEASILEGSDRLLKLKVDLGESEPRQIVAGIREYYTPEELINTQVCVVANLKPATIKGLLSQGMLLAAKDKEGLCLVRPERPRQTGASIG
jgi:methionyl-tRNA synthetase